MHTKIQWDYESLLKKYASAQAALYADFTPFFMDIIRFLSRHDTKTPIMWRRYPTRTRAESWNV
jgi:hypothetical protein